jgi:hypothetical protein
MVRMSSCKLKINSLENDLSLLRRSLKITVSNLTRWCRCLSSGKLLSLILNLVNLGATIKILQGKMNKICQLIMCIQN